MKTPYFYAEAPPFVPPPSVSDTLKRLWLFARHPQPVQREQNVVEVKLPLIFQLSLIELMLQSVLLLLLSTVYNLLDLQTDGQYIPQELLDSTSFTLLFVAVVLVGPLKEELIFRLPLVYSKGFLAVALAVFLFNYGPTVATAAGAAPLHFLLAALALVTLAAVYLRSSSLQTRVHLLWKRHFGLVFYTSCVLFALLHLVNYQNIHLPLFLALLLVLPKFVGGFFLGYTRLRLGLAWAVGQHMFINAIALLLLYGYLSGL
ncbi:CPBP family glutamic-type intramembrane protease [Pontibacter actiniarum]|nr:CPBP family glutamic-type intramembrane protease [Pontibacter actiniarum]